MNIYTHHKEIRIVLTAIANMFEGVIIRRTNSNEHESTIDQISVPVLYSPKTRVIHDLVNLSKHIKLPIFCFQMKGLSYDDTRVFNKLDGFYAPDKIGEKGVKYPQPIPIKITINTSFLARYQDDCDQYITNVFTNFQKYAIISYRHPDVNMEVRCKVIWDGNLNINYPEDLDVQKAYRTEIDASFTVEAWLFRNVNEKDSVIYNIPLTWTALSHLSDNYFEMASRSNELNTDFRTVSGRPWVYDVNRYRIFGDDYNRNFSLEGNMFETATGVVLVDSFNDNKIFESSAYKTYDCYSGDKTLSALYSPFVGVSAEYSVQNDTNMVFTVPKTVSDGYFDVVVLGKYGMGNLKKDSYREYMFDSQKPITLSGIEVVK